MTMPSHVVSAYNDGNNPSSLDVSITTQTQTNSVLIAWALSFDANVPDVTSIVIDPGGGDEESFTYESEVNSKPGGYNIHIECFYLIDPPVGSYTVRFTWNEAQTRALAFVQQFKDAHQTDPLGASGTGSGTSEEGSVDVTTGTANSLVLGCVYTDYLTNLTPGSGDTERLDVIRGGTVGWAGDTPATTTGTYTVSASWTGGGNEDWSALGAELFEAAAAAAGDSLASLAGSKNKKRFQPLLVR